MTDISDHITHREATFSATAIRRKIDNTPNDDQLENMRKLAVNVFEPLRAGLGDRVIMVSSFFRSETLNHLIGGSTTSQHCANNGAAMDMDNDNYSSGPTNYDIFCYIRDNLEFDQLIWEYGNNESPAWVHVSFNEGHNRKQLLRCINGNYHKIY